VQIKRRFLWTIVVAVATVILVILLALIGLGVLVLPGTAPPPPVQVQEVQFTFLQGDNASGLPWFGPNFTYEGAVNNYPYSVAAGTNFTLPVIIYNYDNVNHTVYSMNPSPPFTFEKSEPTLPWVVQPVDKVDDSGIFDLTIQAPNSPGKLLTVYITIDAIAP
jgi:hypothetical protein